MANIFDVLKAHKITVITDNEGNPLIAIDCVQEENHSMASEVTEYEIESGAYISDFILNKNKTITITGLISDDPIEVVQTGLFSRTLTPLLPNALKSKLPYSPFGKNKPSKEIFDKLEEIHNEKIMVNLITGLKEYKNMVMTRLDIPRDRTTVRSLKFTAKFIQVRFVVSEMIYAPATMRRSENLNTDPAKNFGEKSGEKMGVPSGSILWNLSRTPGNIQTRIGAAGGAAQAKYGGSF